MWVQVPPPPPHHPAVAVRMMTHYDDGMRTIIELPAEQLAALDTWRASRGVSRAEAVRRAVTLLLDDDDARLGAIVAACGLWKGRVRDGLEEQERLRSEWEGR